MASRACSAWNVVGAATPTNCAVLHDHHVLHRLGRPQVDRDAASRRRTAGAGPCRRACRAARCPRGTGGPRSPGPGGSAAGTEVPSTFHSLTGVTRDVRPARLREEPWRGPRPGPDRRRSWSGWSRACAIVPSRTSRVFGSTCHRFAASSTSNCRAAAAPWRTAGTVRGVVRLPAVVPSSGTRPVSPMISRIFSGATRSSSAAAWVSSAREPCPISTLPVMTVIAPSRSMCTLVPATSDRPAGRSPRGRRHACRPPRCAAAAAAVTVMSTPAPRNSTKARRLISTGSHVSRGRLRVYRVVHFFLTRLMAHDLCSYLL